MAASMETICDTLSIPSDRMKTDTIRLTYFMCSLFTCTVKLQWLEHLWSHKIIFKTGVHVSQANEC